jgi:hypothetical protein
MAFRIKHNVWLEIELNRIKDFVLMPKYWGVKWTDKKLRRALADIGMEYSEAQILELNDALHTAGIVEDVDD